MNDKLDEAIEIIRGLVIFCAPSNPNTNQAAVMAWANRFLENNGGLIPAPLDGEMR